MNKQFITIITILLIFSIGFLIRIETTNLNGISAVDKSFYQDENGLPYMYELDSYYNYRLTEDYLEHGYLGDAIINGVEWDLHSYYPYGVPLDYPPLIVYLTAFVYKFVNLFTTMPLIVISFWLSAFIAPLAGIVAYFFVGRFTNQYGAAAAGILTVTVPFYFIRTVPGWFDTDMFNIIFPFLVVWFFFEASHNINTKKGIEFSFLSAVFMFLFSLAWNGWQYLFYLIVLFWISYIIWTKFRGDIVKNQLYNFVVFFSFTLILVGMFTGFVNIVKLIYSPLQLFNLSSGGGSWPDWPNIYASVSELSKPSIEELISDLGVTLFAGIFGLLWIFRIMLNDKLHQQFLSKINYLSFSFLVLWMFTGFLALNQGIRFIMILIPPLIVSTGFLIGICIEYLNLLRNNKKFHILQRKPGIIKVFVTLIFVLLLLPGILNIEKGVFFTPGANDDMWDASVWIKNNTRNNTVIISDWGNGHFYTAIADRSVSEDGRMGYIETLPVRNYDDSYPFKDKSPSSSRDYWLKKIFSTDNESLSLGILRMLSTSGDEGYIKLDFYVKNSSKTVEIMNTILGLNRSTSSEILINNYGLDQNQADDVLKFTHPENPAPVVLVTNDKMINIAYWIFNFGEWNFVTKQTNNYTYSVGDVNKTNSSLNSTNGILMDFETGSITWKNKTPYCVVLVNNGTVQKNYIEFNSNFIIFIINSKRAVVMDKKFENSIFTKLVIEKSNSTVFKPIYENKSVLVWEV
ncbi:STT3 domain-containing protein [Methanobacterium sp.]|uniref:STT3 domain-containing protein n=1 Tax=Methanobacterium sp. TaxID=2164 RepID=UPI0025E7DFB5|nr:STT3 domain-containing protein [Methanobacterium sp.]MBI5458136.1 peptide transporter [Methanobacterium sp.]